MDQVIRQMENVFETIDGSISTKYYKNMMRKLINNFSHKCTKLILDGKDRDNYLTPRRWEDLKETMRVEEYFQKSKKGKKARDNVKDRFIFGHGGWRANQNMFVSIWIFLSNIYYGIFVNALCYITFLFVYMSN